MIIDIGKMIWEMIWEICGYDKDMGNYFWAIFEDLYFIHGGKFSMCGGKLFHQLFDGFYGV